MRWHRPLSPVWPIVAKRRSPIARRYNCSRGSSASRSPSPTKVKARVIRATETAGASRLISRHILPNALGPIIVAAAFIVPGAIIYEAVLSYLGIGVRPDVSLNAPFPSSWGQMIQEGSDTWSSHLWMLVSPAIAIALTTLAFTFVGDGLRDALDPREQL